MASNFAKWGTQSRDDRPMHIVLFKSRNKDNKGLDGYHERQVSFVTKEPADSDVLRREFNAFILNGIPGEMSRMYYSVNERDEEKVRKALTHLLIDNPDINLCSLPSKLASIAAAKECAKTSRWLFDFDLNDEEAAKQFAGDISWVTEGAVTVSIHKTPHGYAIIASRGFDTRQLMEKWGDCVTLMKDDMHCVAWGGVKNEQKPGKNTNREDDQTNLEEIQKEGEANTNEKKAIVPLEILLLNDLLRGGAIDQELYDKAKQKITSPVEYIGISEDRLHHLIGVARKAYKIAKEEGHDETFCRRMFMLGWLHDIGYEFSEERSDHPYVSAELLETLGGATEHSEEWANAIDAIQCHGEFTKNETDEWKILNMADMLVNSKGQEVTVSQRLEDIKNRYGACSDQYFDACHICYYIGLITKAEFAENIS